MIRPMKRTATGFKRTRRKPPIASALRDEPSLFELVTLYGEKSKRFTALPSLMSYAFSYLPSEEAKDISQDFYDKRNQNYLIRYDSVAHKLKDIFRDIQVINTVDTEKLGVPIAEIHRPKIEGCRASFEQTYRTLSDYSLSIKVFGTGFGLNKSRELGIGDKITDNGECLALMLRVTVEWQECVRSSGPYRGQKFTRANVIDIGTDFNEIELSGDSDKCKISEDMVSKSMWEIKSFKIPENTEREKKLSVETSQGLEFSFQTKILGAELGPKAVVKYLKNAEYSYNLTGPHSYNAYLPKNNLGYCWNWS